MERHRFDVLSFAFGLVYTLAGLIFLLPATPFDLVDTVALSMRWVWPAAILVIGAAILIPLIRPRNEEK
ncbi:MAG TPA: hypothetical protein VHL52_13700 [Acidimicrobiia bacterium]|jgi:hypothetical protein|nr:hypothetical protein [Acidimicrobiia bacterium]